MSTLIVAYESRIEGSVAIKACSFTLLLRGGAIVLALFMDAGLPYISCTIWSCRFSVFTAETVGFRRNLVFGYSACALLILNISSSSPVNGLEEGYISLSFVTDLFFDLL